MTPPPRSWGIRFFLLQDGLAIAAAAGLSWLLHATLPDERRWLWPLPALVLLHFFLFCNVFRIRRRYELLWAAVFVANAIGWWLGGVPSCWPVLAVQTPFTLLAIGAEVRSPRYHGVRADRWNPQLARWLAGENFPH